MRILRFAVNGDLIEIGANDSETLLEALRDRLGLTGTKRGCDLGACGACTVLLDGRPILSCLLPVWRVQGRVVTTIEGLAEGPKLHPLQEAFHMAGAVQCGFCTPGMILSAKAYLDTNLNPVQGDIREALAGNLCRCTGYVKVMEAVKLAATWMRDTTEREAAR